MPKPVANLPRLPSGRAADNKAARVVTQIVFDLATGQLKPGQRLPSIRAGEREFGCHQLTLLSAYRELVRLGLAKSVPRSGFFIADTRAVGRMTTHGPRLGRLYDDIAETIRAQTDLHVLGVFRYLAHLAEKHAAAAPECAFVECTAFQARGHADEIQRRLDVPCAPLTTRQVAGRRDHLPSSVRTLITTNFHIAELRHLHAPPELSVTDVVIELDPGVMASVSGAKEVTFVTIDVTNAEKMACDVRDRLGTDCPRLLAMSATEAGINDVLSERLAGSDAERCPVRIVLSPSLWEAAAPEWTDNPAVIALKYRIRESDWTRVAEGMGLPVH